MSFHCPSEVPAGDAFLPTGAWASFLHRNMGFIAQIAAFRDGENAARLHPCCQENTPVFGESPSFRERSMSALDTFAMVKIYWYLLTLIREGFSSENTETAVRTYDGYTARESA